MRGRRHRPDRSGPPADLQPRVVPQGVRIERQRALEPVRRAAADGWAWISQEPCSIGRVSAPAARPPRIQIPRWIQLVGLPLLLVFGWFFVRAAGHAVFLFLVAALIALLLDPIVLTLGVFRIRRGISVALVYITFAGALILILIAVTTVVVGQTRTAANRFNDYFTDTHGRSHQTSADRDVDRLQTWLNSHHLRSIKVEKSGHRLVKRIRNRDVGKYTHRLVDFVEGAAISIGRALFDAVL